MSCAPHYCKEYNKFAGAAHVIPDDKGYNISSDEPPRKTREPPHSMMEQYSRKTRECSEYDKTREQASIPYSSLDFHQSTLLHSLHSSVFQKLLKPSKRIHPLQPPVAKKLPSYYS